MEAVARGDRSMQQCVKKSVAMALLHLRGRRRWSSRSGGRAHDECAEIEPERAIATVIDGV